MRNAQKNKSGPRIGIRNFFLMRFVWITVFLSAGSAFGIMVQTKDEGGGFCERVLYDLVGPTFLSNVYVRFPDGDLQNLSPSTNGIYYQAHVNRKGTKVVFYGNESGPPRIWLSDLETGETRPLTPKNVSARHPVFSWDGAMIGFSSDFNHTQHLERIELMHGDGRPPKNCVRNIYIMDIKGNGLRQITTGPFIDQRPMFSPDGQTIAFVSNRDGRERVWTVSLDGRQEPVPLQNEGFGYRPSYSPDGEKIYFFTENNRSHQLAFMNLSDQKISLLNDFGRGNEHGPFVGYDGKSLLMHSNRGGKWEIWKVSLQDQELQKIGVPFDEALHATVSENGIIAFDVPRIHEIRKLLSQVKIMMNQTVHVFDDIFQKSIVLSAREPDTFL